MAKLMNGQITSIDEGIVADIELVTDFANVHASKAIFLEKDLEDAVTRIRSYLATYKLEENHE